MLSSRMLEKIYNWMGHPWVPTGRSFGQTHGLGWAAFGNKTMGGLGQCSKTHGSTFIGPTQPIQTSGR